jgi:ABC-type histidine transport system ATPase subunit
LFAIACAFCSGECQERCQQVLGQCRHKGCFAFDEPTSELVGEVLEVIRALAQDGMTMLVVMRCSSGASSSAGCMARLPPPDRATGATSAVDI